MCEKDENKTEKSRGLAHFLKQSILKSLIYDKPNILLQQILVFTWSPPTSTIGVDKDRHRIAAKCVEFSRGLNICEAKYVLDT